MAGTAGRAIPATDVQFFAMTSREVVHMRSLLILLLYHVFRMTPRQSL